MENNILPAYQTVTDRFGKKHKVYGVRFKDLQTVTQFTEKYSPDSFTMYMLSPAIDDNGEIKKTPDGGVDYDNGFRDALMEIIALALDGRETEAQIDEWLDMNIAREIVMIFLGMSQFRQKKT